MFFMITLKNGTGGLGWKKNIWAAGQGMVGAIGD